MPVPPLKPQNLAQCPPLPPSQTSIQHQVICLLERHRLSPVGIKLDGVPFLASTNRCLRVQREIEAFYSSLSASSTMANGITTPLSSSGSVDYQLRIHE